MAKKKTTKTKPAPKKKTTRKPRAKPAPASLQKLNEDPSNPRSISEVSAAGLRKSIDEFGDLSGIVLNRRTGELVAGHKRREQLVGLHGDLPIVYDDSKTKRGADVWGHIETPDGHRFSIRVVDWPVEKQRTANVTANNPHIQGKFNHELDAYLASIVEADETLADDLLLRRLEQTIETDGAEVEIPQVYDLHVQCETEERQRELFDRLQGEGWKCKPVTVEA